MHPILECMEKGSRLVVGLMSGTSADGVDAALCQITGHGTASRIEQLGFVFQPFSGEVRREILRLSSGNSACAADFCKMNFLLGELYVRAVEALCAAHSSATRMARNISGRQCQPLSSLPLI